MAKGCDPVFRIFLGRVPVLHKIAGTIYKVLQQALIVCTPTYKASNKFFPFSSIKSALLYFFNDSTASKNLSLSACVNIFTPM